nr:MAG TPA: hypothetical protein [Caudoviricetes sp.]
MYHIRVGVKITIIFFSYKNMWLYGVFLGKTVRPNVFTGFAACFFT